MKCINGRKSLSKGERVAWQYQHCLGRDYTIITRRGRFIKYVRHQGFSLVGAVKDGTAKDRQYAIVQFEGNKRPSRVLVYDLWRESEFEAELAKQEDE